MPSEPRIRCPQCQTIYDDGRVCPVCSEALPPGTELHHRSLRIERLLGRGGFACTYLATDTLLDRPVAVKEFFPTDCHRVRGSIEGPADFASACQRFLDEARLLVRFRHDSIVAVHALFEENNTAYMVMEYLEGESLNRHLQHGPLTIAQAARVGREVGRALAVLHEAGLLHRDVKPDNIMETRDGRIVLIDFGTARLYRGNPKVTTILTPAYAPIEQYSDQGQRGPASDIYALGATLYELLCGEPPPPAQERLLGRSMRSLHDRLPAVSEGFSQAISKALEVQAEARWQTVGAFVEALAATSGPAVEGGPWAAVCTARLCGHRGIIRSVALSPGGVLAATAAEDKTVRLWDGGNAVGVLEGHSGWVSSVEFTPDGQQVVSGSHDRTIRTWDVASGRMVSKVETPDGVVSLALSWDGHGMAAGLQNRKVLLWRDGQRIAESQNHPAPVVAVAFAADSTWLAVAASGTAAVRLLDPKGVEQTRLEQAATPVRALAAAPHRGLLAAGLADGSVLVWEVAQGTVTRVLGAGRREVVGMVWTRDGQWLVVARRRQVVDVFEVGSGRLLLSFEAHSRELTAVAAVGRVLLTASADESAMRWEVGCG